MPLGHPCALEDAVSFVHMRIRDPHSCVRSLRPVLNQRPGLAIGNAFSMIRLLLSYPPSRVLQQL